MELLVRTSENSSVVLKSSLCFQAPSPSLDVTFARHSSPVIRQFLSNRHGFGDTFGGSCPVALDLARLHK